MINIPLEYQVNRKIAIKTILSEVLKPEDKKILKNSLKAIQLTHQISGESIPSYIDELYRCEAIMFLDVEISNIRQSESVSTILHQLIKPFCVIHCYDNNQESFSFAVKRINLKESCQIVLEQRMITSPDTINSYTQHESLFAKALDFENLVNRVNKRELYIEAMTKAFIVTHPALFLRITDFINSSVWYNSKEVLELLKKFELLKSLNQQKKKALLVKDKVLMNSQIKSVLGELELQLEQLIR